MTTTLDPEAPARDSAVTGTALRRQLAAALRVLLALTVLLGVVYPRGDLGRVPPAGARRPTPRARLTPDGLLPHRHRPRRPPTRPPTPGSTPGRRRRRRTTRSPASAPPTRRPRAAPTSAPPPRTWAPPSRSAGPPIAAREGVDPAAVPPDALTASGSGLDPQISPAYAELQVPRVARVTGLAEDRVRALVADATDGRSLGVLGEPRVDVPALDASLVAAAPGIR